MTEAERSAMNTIRMYGLIFSMQGADEKQRAALNYAASVLKEREQGSGEEAAG